MSTRAARRPIVTALVALALVGTTAACAPQPTTQLLTGAPGGSSAQESLQDSAASRRRSRGGAAAAGTATAAEDCSDGLPAVASIDPGGSPEVTSGSTMADIRERGALMRRRLGRHPAHGLAQPVPGEIEGFDIDVPCRSSAAIFGDPDQIQFRVITSGDQRLDVLQDHEVDLVARTFTMNCERWENIAFSAEYLPRGPEGAGPSRLRRRRASTTWPGSASARPRAPRPWSGSQEWDRASRRCSAADPHRLPGPVPAGRGRRHHGRRHGPGRASPRRTRTPRSSATPFSDEPYGVGVPADQAGHGAVRQRRARPDMVRTARGRRPTTAGWATRSAPHPAAPEPVYGRTP